MEFLIEANPFATAPSGADAIAWINRPMAHRRLPPLISASGDWEGHMVLSIRPACTDARFANCAREVDGNGGVQFDCNDLAIIECKPQDEAGSHAHAVEAIRALARHALRSGWRVWHGFSGLGDPMLEVVDGEGGLFWERHEEPLILFFLPPQDSRRAS